MKRWQLIQGGPAADLDEALALVKGCVFRHWHEYRAFKIKASDFGWSVKGKR